MTPCTRCKGEAFFEGLCKSCFRPVIEKRIRKELRAKGLIKKNDRLLVKDPFCRHVLRDILGELPVEFVEQGDYDKEVIYWTMEDELEQFLDALFTGKPIGPLGHSPTRIKLFLPVRDKELEAFAAANGQTFPAKPRTKLAVLLGDMETKYPEVKFSLLKSISELKEAMQEHGKAQS